ncbi:MAG TPA: hypothetical protein VF627_03590 [Abditibacterium sp.]|jgi:lincosamide nucleotidyltransferase A/C/D/E
MNAENVTELYLRLLNQGVQLWVDGGWGIDALLGRQTRPHKDLDALVQWDDLAPLTDILAGEGFQLKEIWTESRWASHPLPLQLIAQECGGENAFATAFVLKDERGRELDFHVLHFDEHGQGIPQWQTDFIYPAEALEAVGRIGNTDVKCLSAAMQMQTHTGYPLQDKDLEDLRQLHERFGLSYPPEIAHYFR